MAAHGETLATAGEDGKVNVINIRQRNPVKVIFVLGYSNRKRVGNKMLLNKELGYVFWALKQFWQGGVDTCIVFDLILCTYYMYLLAIFFQV